MTREPPTSQDNVEIARQGFETYNRYGVRAVAEQHWHPDVEWHVGPWAVAFGGPSQFRGREAGIAAFRELEAVMGQFTADVLDAVEGPEGVFVAVRLQGKGARSGAAVEQCFWYAIEMDGGWERRIRVCGDPVEALEAVGLRE
jgi:ketosteroid isomerase-like protein